MKTASWGASLGATVTSLVVLQDLTYCMHMYESICSI